MNLVAVSRVAKSVTLSFVDLSVVDQPAVGLAIDFVILSICKEP